METQEVIEKVRKAIDEGKWIKMVLRISGVHRSGENKYWLKSHLTITANNEVIFDRSEIVRHEDTIWFGSFAGSTVEELYMYLEEIFRDYIYGRSIRHYSRCHMFTTIFYKPAK